MSLSPDTQALLAHVPADGSTIGNIKLREALGWDEQRYVAARQPLLDQGLLVTGKGRGGAVMRNRSAKSASVSPGSQALEMFAADEVASPAPPKPAAKAPAAKAAPVSGATVTNYQYPSASRKNIPPAGLATKNTVQETNPHHLAYDPHLSPVLRFDSTSGTDHLLLTVKDILEKAKTGPLTPEETEILSDALLRSRQPWLEWAGKREKRWFEVDPVALHIHERVRTRAILKAALREDLEPTFWDSPKLSREEAMSFYQHDVDWENRLILGDSLQVMTSLARREGLAGKVQMFYIDPPYGIKFSSNWQNQVGNKDVKDLDEDLTREPEMIKAYRDTWTLGVHSYLDYLKQRLIASRELLTDSGSVFVQISDENLHRIRAVMDEVFGAENFVALIAYQTSVGLGAELIDRVANYLIWYCKKADQIKYKPLFRLLELGDEGATRYSKAENQLNGESRTYGENEAVEAGWRPFTDQGLTSRSGSDTTAFPVEFRGIDYKPTVGGWRTGKDGFKRVNGSERILSAGKTIRFKKCFDDFGAIAINNSWNDVRGGIQSRDDPKVYVVQTATKIVQRCMLMTTDPGDLVIDPTCGSGTTAYVAEQWGRRWITIDSSRVAVAIARQRLLTAKFDTFKTKDPSEGVDPTKPKDPKTGFHYKSVAHITLKSIAQNKGLDPIFDKHAPILDLALHTLNGTLFDFPPTLHQQLVRKLIAKHQEEGARAVTDADQRRWLLPGTAPQLIQSLKGGKGQAAISLKQAQDYRNAIPEHSSWFEWQVPFDTDPDWPAPLQAALSAYRLAWRAKMDEVNSCIEANAEQEELVDQPEIVRGITRVSGPFTVESVRPLEDSLKGTGHETPDSPIAGGPEELEDSFDDSPERDVSNAVSHIERMVALLRVDGLTIIGNKHLQFLRLDPIESEFLHADGESVQKEGEEPRRVAVVIGPEHGAIGSFQVKTAISSASQRGYNDLIFAGFAFDAASQDKIHEENEDPASKLNVLMALIRPDVLLGDLLKGNKISDKKAETAKASQQLFTVFGQPRTRIETKGQEFIAHMDGVDVYDPVKNSIEATKAGKVAAWFLDTNYDGRTFCICQAFFPDKSAWEKLSKALSSSIDPEAFAAFSGTKSLPFHPGEHKRVAIKVIDPRGNEVMRVHSL
jgi:adenine-specific DNA-methyltransferase